VHRSNKTRAVDIARSWMNGTLKQCEMVSVSRPMESPRSTNIDNFLQVLGLYKGGVLQIAAEYGVANVDDNGLGSLSVNNTRHMNV